MYNNPISEIFARTELERVMSFILNGAEDSDISKEPYSTRLTKASRPIVKRLESIYPNADDMDNANQDLTEAFAAFQYVYMEIGMKVGARLLHQLLSSSDGSVQNEQ